MSSIQSLGLHEPSAVPYLVSASILPPDPSPSLYKWTLSRVYEKNASKLVEEEILITAHCVVWSRNGAIERALNLSVEGETILHAFVTRFGQPGTGQNSGQHQNERVKPGDRGLVVVFKTQVHIFLLSGDSYVFPLSFEVESAFPYPCGFILQRKLSDRESGGFVEHVQHDLSTINETLTSIGDNSSRPSLILPEKRHSDPRPLSSSASGMPRTFSFTEIMSELGLVVWSPNRKGEALEECNALPRSEKLIYITAGDEVGFEKASDRPVCMALTFNEKTATFTLWHVSGDAMSEQQQARSRQDGNAKSRASLRKSSNIYGRDHGTLRESLLGSRPSHPDGGPFSSLEEQKSFPVNDLASQLGPEFGDVGVQTRSARRVSSMLARTDLGPATDRNTFNDLALGHAGRQSLNRAGRRGESIGSFNDRQSFGFRRRSSFPTNASILSNGTSFLDISARALLEEFDPLRQSTRLEDDTFDGPETNLPKSVGFFKVKSFPRRQSAPESNSAFETKVLQLSSGTSFEQDGKQTRDVYLCVLDKSTQEMTIIRVLVKRHIYGGTRKSTVSKHSLELKAAEVRSLPGIKDACTVVDRSIQRLVVLTQSRSQMIGLQLESPWSPSFQIGLPVRYAIYDPLVSPQPYSPRKDKDTGIRRVIPAKDVQIQALFDSGIQAQIYVVDQDKRRHALGIQLAPQDPLVQKVLNMCNMVLGPNQQESLLVAFWEVARWLKGRETPVTSEWTALLVVLFSLGVPFISSQHSQSTPTRRRTKTAFLRSSSGSAIDLTNYNLMHHAEDEMPQALGLQAPAWEWMSQKPLETATVTPKSKHSRAASATSFQERAPEKKNAFLLTCIALAREYTQTPIGESALGPEGYLPTSINREREQRCNAIPSILLGLHLLYEEDKLNTVANPGRKDTRTRLLVALVQLGLWLGWTDWTAGSNTYYGHESAQVAEYLFDDSLLDGLRIPAQPFPPPSIYEHYEKWIKGISPAPFLTLTRLSGLPELSNHDHPLWWQAASLTPRTLELLTFMDQAKDQLSPHKAVAALLRSGLNERILSTLPDGVAAAFHQTIASYRYRADKIGDQVNQLILGRDAASHRGYDLSHHSYKPHLVLPPSHEAVKDYHTVCSSATETETLQRWDASSEADRHAISRLIFNEDRRFSEASKLVNQSRPPVVECTPEPGWSDVDMLEAQKELAQYVTLRTLSVAAGRGMMHFSGRVPLLTERVPSPAFSLQCIMKPRNASEGAQAMTFSADKATYTEEKVCWAFFHNGASTGLMISTDAKGINTSWIQFNKPPDLTNRHAGFLLALGLNGHLRTLAKWVAFKYLTPKHTMTSVGLLLGLSASFLGTMDTLITRLLSVHVTRLLPPGAAELNLSPLTQTTGIMGIGLLYCNSQHRRMSEVMLSEIENDDPEEGVALDNVLRDEGYRLAAGFSLGLINLGQGKRLHGLHDMGVVERLLTIAVGTKNVNMVHVLDRATAGAVMAIAFIFMKTNDRAIAQKVDIPDTLHQFDYVRPDIFLLRTLARHLIMWDSIQPTDDFIGMSLPEPYRSRIDLKATKFLSTEDMPFFNIIAGVCFAIGLRFAGSQRQDVRDLLVSYLDNFIRLSRLPAHNYDSQITLNSVRNCLDTLALASATVMAGSGDLVVMRRLRALHGRTDKDTPFGSHLAAHMALGALFLAGGTRTFGTSNLGIASLCIAFYPIFPNDVLDNRGHLQALRHLWVLAAEGRCLVARDGDAGGSVPGGITGRINLKNGETQTIPLPGLIPEFDTIKSIDIKGEGFWDGHLDFEAGGQALREKIKSENAVNVVLRRRTVYDEPPKNLFMAELQAKALAMGIPSIDPNAFPSYTSTFASSSVSGAGIAASAARSTTPNPFEWIFEIGPLRDFDHAERALILGPTPIDGKETSRATVVDSRLEFEQGVLPRSDPVVQNGGTGNGQIDKDKLWQLRLLFAWLDRWEREDEDHDRRKQITERVEGSPRGGDSGNDNADKWFSDRGGTWLRREVIEKLKWRVWNLTTGPNDEDYGARDYDANEML
ncbi:Negative regulator of mitosis [Fonsecaea pedrosoi]|nr:Negative regulator of mitosis [Fonsecaea pedrosoi]